MKPIMFEGANAEIAKDQEEYQTLPALVRNNDQGEVISCWLLSKEELRRVQESGCVYLSCWTFGLPLQPLLLSADPADLGLSGWPKRKRTGAERIERERARQILEEGYDEKHDARHTDGALAIAAACYATAAGIVLEMNGLQRSLDIPRRYEACPTPTDWPWPDASWRPTPQDPIRMLEKAGALIAAQIDQLQQEREQMADRLRETIRAGSRHSKTEIAPDEQPHTDLPDGRPVRDGEW